MAFGAKREARGEIAGGRAMHQCRHRDSEWRRLQRRASESTRGAAPRHIGSHQAGSDKSTAR